MNRSRIAWSLGLLVGVSGCAGLKKPPAPGTLPADAVPVGASRRSAEAVAPTAWTAPATERSRTQAKLISPFAPPPRGSTTTQTAASLNDPFRQPAHPLRDASRYLPGLARPDAASAPPGGEDPLIALAEEATRSPVTVPWSRERSRPAAATPPVAVARSADADPVSILDGLDDAPPAPPRRGGLAAARPAPDPEPKPGKSNRFGLPGGNWWERWSRPRATSATVWAPGDRAPEPPVIEAAPEVEPASRGAATAERRTPAAVDPAARPVRHSSVDTRTPVRPRPRPAREVVETSEVAALPVALVAEVDPGTVMAQATASAVPRRRVGQPEATRDTALQLTGGSRSDEAHDPFAGLEPAVVRPTDSTDGDAEAEAQALAPEAFDRPASVPTLAPPSTTLPNAATAADAAPAASLAPADASPSSPAADAMGPEPTPAPLPPSRRYNTAAGEPGAIRGVSQEPAERSLPPVIRATSSPDQAPPATTPPQPQAEAPPRRLPDPTEVHATTATVAVAAPASAAALAAAQPAAAVAPAPVLPPAAPVPAAPVPAEPGPAVAGLALAPASGAAEPSEPTITSVPPVATPAPLAPTAIPVAAESRPVAAAPEPASDRSARAVPAPATPVPAEGSPAITATTVAGSGAVPASALTTPAPATIPMAVPGPVAANPVAIAADAPAPPAPVQSAATTPVSTTAPEPTTAPAAESPTPATAPGTPRVQSLTQADTGVDPFASVNLPPPTPVRPAAPARPTGAPKPAPAAEPPAPGPMRSTLPPSRRIRQLGPAAGAGDAGRSRSGPSHRRVDPLSATLPPASFPATYYQNGPGANASAAPAQPAQVARATAPTADAKTVTASATPPAPAPTIPADAGTSDPQTQPVAATVVTPATAPPTAVPATPASTLPTLALTPASMPERVEPPQAVPTAPRPGMFERAPEPTQVEMAPRPQPGSRRRFFGLSLGGPATGTTTAKPTASEPPKPRAAGFSLFGRRPAAKASPVPPEPRSALQEPGSRPDPADLMPPFDPMRPGSAGLEPDGVPQGR